MHHNRDFESVDATPPPAFGDDALSRVAKVRA